MIVEDDVTSRKLLQELLKDYGQIDLAFDGSEALSATKAALLKADPYHLICLDILMPQMDGHTALEEIRALEEFMGVPVKQCSKVLMTTGLSDSKNVLKAFNEQCDAYLVKPIDKGKLLDQLRRFELIA